jgi:hypothetical protein
MRSLLYGVFCIIGGLTGTLVLRGTGSSFALVLAGIVFVIIGFARMNGSEHGARPTQDDVERDEAQWAEYQQAKLKNFKNSALQQLIDATPGAQATVQELMERTKAHLSGEEQLDLALETAKRLYAEQQPAA